MEMTNMQADMILGQLNTIYASLTESFPVLSVVTKSFPSEGVVGSVDCIGITSYLISILSNSSLLVELKICAFVTFICWK